MTDVNIYLKYFCILKLQIRKKMIFMFDWIMETLSLAYREAWAVMQIFDNIKNLFENLSFQKIIATFTAIAELLGMLIFGMPVTPRGQELDLSDYSLVFYDEFDGDFLDTTVWKHRGVGARRFGYNAASQSIVENGNLVITGEYLTDGEYGEGWYAGAVSLLEKYTYGYYEIRCICNPDDEYWSAFWIHADSPYNAEYSQGGVGGAEIDIFESFGYGEFFNDSITSTIHCSGVDGVQEGFQSANLGKFRGNNIFEEYNTYGLEWTEDEYIFYTNGVETCRSTFGNGTSKVPEEVILSLELPNEITHEKDFSTQFVIDYIKIYQK